MKNIKSYLEFLNEKKENKPIILNENIDNKINLDIIADEIINGETSGEEPVKWDLEVSIQDWVKLDDEDIDYIASQIRDGSLIGNDPIDWKLDIVDDSIVEEEEYTRNEIGTNLDLNEGDFEDSSDLGDMADNLSDDASIYDYAYDEAEMLFDAFLMSDKGKELSSIFSNVISSDFQYKRFDKIYKEVLEYISVFENEFGHLEYKTDKNFEQALTNIIKKYLKKGGISESKKDGKKLVGKIKDFKIFYSDKTSKKDKDMFIIIQGDKQIYDTKHLDSAISHCIELKELKEKDIKKWIVLAKEFDPTSAKKLEKLIKEA